MRARWSKVHVTSREVSGEKVYTIHLDMDLFNRHATFFEAGNIEVNCKPIESMMLNRCNEVYFRAFMEDISRDTAQMVIRYLVTAGEINV